MRQLSRSISQMEQNPFQGNVKTLQGKEWKGYRIIFFPHRDDEQQIVDIAWVGLKSEKTYR